MSLYQDPGMPGRVRPNLVAELLGQPAWEQHHQLENQASIVLAWLIDRCPAVARRLLDLWLEDLELPADALIGARDQLSFPSKLRPDISIEVGDRALQLLIEVKVGAQFAEHAGRAQDDAYRIEWAAMEEGEAQLRAVGTLTRDASDLLDEVNLSDLRARDVEWSELKVALREVADGEDLDSSLIAVIESFCDAIDLHIDVATVDDEAVPDFLARACPLVEEIASQAGEALGAAASIAHGAHYAGAKLSYEALDGNPVVVRVVAGVAGGAMTPIGAGPTLLIGVGRDHSILLKGEERARGLSAGLELIKTLQFTFTGLRRPFEEVEEQPACIVSELIGTLTTASMLPSGPNPGRAREVGAALDYEHKGHINLPPGWRATPSVESDDQ